MHGRLITRFSRTYQLQLPVFLTWGSSPFPVTRAEDDETGPGEAPAAAAWALRGPGGGGAGFPCRIRTPADAPWSSKCPMQATFCVFSASGAETPGLFVVLCSAIDGHDGICFLSQVEQRCCIWSRSRRQQDAAEPDSIGLGCRSAWAGTARRTCSGLELKIA